MRRTTSSMSGSSMARVSHLCHRRDPRQHGRSRGRLRVEGQALAQPLGLVGHEGGPLDVGESRGGQREVDDEQPLRPHGGTETGERPVEGEHAPVDDQHPVAEPFDVAHVVGGEQQRDAAVAPLGHEKLTQPLLREHVEPDGRLVEDQQVRGVQQGGRDLGPHPLTERERAHRGAQLRAHLELLDERAGSRAAGRWVESVDGGQDRERLPQWQIPPQLRPLAEHHAHPSGHLDPLAHRVEAAGAHVARRRLEDAGQHLDRRRLAGAVGADVPHGLAGPHDERHTVDGPRLLEVTHQLARLDDGAHPPAPW